MKYFCNPLNVNYRYQFNADPRLQKIAISREAADPSMICFKDSYYIFASMTLGVWTSKNLTDWAYHRLPDNLPLYDYAPDVRVMGEYVYFCASRKQENCSHYRTKDILKGPYEEIEGSFDFWDPNMFVDDDNRVYFYWGCSNITPIWGVELDPVTMLPIGERKELISGHPFERGYERMGVDHCDYPRSEQEIEICYQHFLKQQGKTEEEIPPYLIPAVKGMFSKKPFIEGAWMDKHKGKYYLQYACPGAEYNTYADGVYIGESPLGPFVPAENNPFSYKPGGFIPGAGHGSTMKDRYDNLWHTSTMRISMNHQFERRIGLWPAGFDQDGELFCNQRYGDWPIAVEDGENDPWRDPEWNLLSFGKSITASTTEKEYQPENAVDENVQTWWRAASAESGQWLQLDLGKAYDVHAIQINFADDQINIPTPGEIRGTTQPRYIEEQDGKTQWKLEGSIDNTTYFMIEDKSSTETDLPHDLVVIEEGRKIRYLRLTIIKIPYDQKPCISGLRVFGKGDGKRPDVPEYTAIRTSDLDMSIIINKGNALGYNILWGTKIDKLYHSYMIFSNTQKVGALVKNQDYYVRVDAFNENGITEGKVCRI